MLSYTSEYETAIRSVTRELKGYLQFNGDSTKQISGDSGLVSFKVHHTAMNEERFCIGSTCSAYCEASFFNSGLPSGVSLANSYFDAYIGVVLADSSVEYKPMGRFYINEISRGKETTAIVGYDVTCKLDKDYTPTVTRASSGYLVMDILNDIIDQTGVNGGQHFTNVGNDVYVAEIYEGTCREQWGWLMLLCSALGVNSVGSRVDLGWIEERSFSDGDLPYLRYSAVDDSLIYLDGIDSGDLFTVNSITTGTDDSPIVVGNGVGINSPNPYINQTQAEAIYSTLHGASFTPMRLHFRGDPCIEVMDSFKVVQDGETYRCVAMSIETTFNGGLEQTIECWGDSEEYYAMSSGRMNTIESKVYTNSTMLQDIARSIETARGGYIHQILDENGAWKELVIANSMDLSQASSVWRFNLAGLAHSTRYTGGVYSFALDDDGNIVANRIQVGTLQDAAGNNSWNMETGEFNITNGTFHVTTVGASDNIIRLVAQSDEVGNDLTYVEVGNEEIAFTEVWDETYATINSTGYHLWKHYEPGITDPLFAAEYTNDGITLYTVDTAAETSTLFATLNADGLTFYNANGTVSAEFPSRYKSRESFGTITPYSSRGTVDSGGFYRVGSQCNINFLFTSSYSATNTPRITGMSAVPQFIVPLQAIDLTTHEPVGCYVNTAGNIYLKSTVSGHQYAIGGTFII